MFRRLGLIISQGWIAILAGWLVIFIGLRTFSPPFDDFAKGGEFVFLPDSMPSRQSELLLGHAFPGRQATSNIVIVAHRDEPNGLSDDDREFITGNLRPKVEQLRDTFNKPAHNETAAHTHEENAEFIKDIHGPSDRGIGELLVSGDKQANLLTIELASDFQDPRNWKVVQKVSDILANAERDAQMPRGLHLAMTGSATLGRDISSAEASSAHNTGPLTILMVIVLLAVIYRAPLLALVPLLTLFVAVDVSLNLLAVLAQAGYVPLFRGLQVYTTVISYGPGIDYCLFLIARYKENLRDGMMPKVGVAVSIGHVGSAIAASAATVICGIGMLTFAEFGKFHEAGIGISIALAITLIATLTLTPSLLCLTGRWAFWPSSVTNANHQPGQQQPERVAVQSNFFQPLWTYMGDVIERHPMRLLLATLGGLAPFALLGLRVYGNVNYGLLETLPHSAVSASGAQVLEAHFPVGITGPINVLLQNSKMNFAEDDGIEFVTKLVERLMKRHDELKLVDIRSVSHPLGVNRKTQDDSTGESFVTKAVERKNIRRRSIEQYVSANGALSGHVTELDLILSTNPFSKESIAILDRLPSVIREELPADQKDNTTMSFVGPTASVRDVNTISRSDQLRIFTLVVSCVLLILVVLLRAFVVSLYLILTVLLSYIATLGITWLTFSLLDQHSFIGLDWTVALFLFVVLIAVGEDYNIFLVTRIHEEQARHGPRQGIVIALSRTGGIITSCGFIMAGSFASLCAGSLARMQQLGFALAFGVLLDTFVIRPIVVPAFLMILHDNRYGNLSRYLK